MTSQMNRGEALRCIQIAKKCIQEQKLAKAEKFLRKSLRMYETKEAQALLASLSNPQQTPPNQPSTPPNTFRTTSQPPPDQQQEPQRPQRSSTMPNLDRNTTASQSTSSNIGSQSTSRMGKAEEVEMVKKILRARDYYAILGVDKGESDEKILKKAYRKKALKCHPDRNKAPGTLTMTMIYLCEIADCIPFSLHIFCEFDLMIFMM